MKVMKARSAAGAHQGGGPRVVQQAKSNDCPAAAPCFGASPSARRFVICSCAAGLLGEYSQVIGLCCGSSCGSCRQSSACVLDCERSEYSYVVRALEPRACRSRERTWAIRGQQEMCLGRRVAGGYWYVRRRGKRTREAVTRGQSRPIIGRLNFAYIA